MTEFPYLPEYDQAALSNICRDFGVRLLILFGSRATGCPPPTPESDLDLAVLFTEKQDLKGFLKLEHALSRFLDTTRLDLADLSRADPLFRWEIFANGKLLYGEELDFLQYKAYAYRDYRDSQDLRDLENILLEKRMRYIGRHLSRKPEDEAITPNLKENRGKSGCNYSPSH